MKTSMKRSNRSKPEGRCGTLPACAPLATPYVPYQQDNPPQYDARKGLVRGTMFPGLDLPFLGMDNDCPKPQTLQAQIQAVSFAVTELSLYLDTHRDDAEALEVYRSYQKVLQELNTRWCSECGPMSHQCLGRGPYRWLDDPWPWEYCANGEE